MMTIFYFVISLGLLVLVHEWGHFIVARMNGIKVLKFSIGFGPKLFSFQWGDTQYLVCLIPLGGYVQLFGEDPESESDGDKEKAERISTSPDAFSSKPLRARFATVLAGPSMNLILACLFMPIAFLAGRMQPHYMEDVPVVSGIEQNSPAALAGFEKGDKIVLLNGKEVKSWEGFLNWIVMNPEEKAAITVERQGERKAIEVTTTLSPLAKQRMGYLGIEPFYFVEDDAVIGGFAPGSAAKEAGLKEMDHVVAINGQPLENWTRMTELIRSSQGEDLKIDVLRGEEKISVTVKPKHDPDKNVWLLGVNKYDDPNFYIKKKYSLGESIKRGWQENVKLAKLTGEVVWKLVTFQLSYKALGGPVQIAQATAHAANTGLGDFFYFLAFLSLQLGIMNLLPIPVLDGGHLFFMSIEALRRGRPVPLKIRIISQQVGMALLLTVMVLVTVNDIDSVWGFSKMFDKIRSLF